MSLKKYDEFLNESFTPLDLGVLAFDCLLVLSQCQVYHWQVKGQGSYTAHKELDNFMDGFKNHMDNLLEGLQGKYNRVIIPNDCKLYNISEKNIKNFLEEYIEKFVEHREAYNDEYDASAILDEMIGLMNKLKYILTFE